MFYCRLSVVALGCQILLTLSHSLHWMLQNRPRLQPSLRPSLESLVCMNFRMSSVFAESQQGQVKYLTTVAIVYEDDTSLNMVCSLNPVNHNLQEITRDNRILYQLFDLKYIHCGFTLCLSIAFIDLTIPKGKYFIL